MPHQHTGNRIRERRFDRGLRQTDLAALVGISPSYLNLIEHNSRRIGGKLLIDIAQALGVDPAQLTDSAEQLVVGGLRAAAADMLGPSPELGRTEDLIGRFPGWASLVTAQANRIRQLEAQVADLSDRITQNPELATSLHQVITAVTAIRSAASILITDPDLDHDWQSRFHRNIHDDSIKLAESSRSLVKYLEGTPAAKAITPSQTEQIAHYLDEVDHHIASLEGDDPADDLSKIVSEAVERSPGIDGGEAEQGALMQWLIQYRADAIAMPLRLFGAAARDMDHDPTPLARQFGVSMSAVLRRLASLPRGQGHPAMGLAVCDAAGAVLHIKKIPGFSIPRDGVGCPLWPLYQAFAQPGRGLRSVASMPGEHGAQFLCHAIAVPRSAPGFDEMPAMISTMLVRATDHHDNPPRPVGTTCRICSHDDCASRREPSILLR